MKFLATVALLSLAVVNAMEAHEAFGINKEDILETVDISGDGGILKLVYQKGNGDVPPNGANINAHYTGKLTDGNKFDSSRDRGQPFSFKVGTGQVIQGWDKSFATMSVGEKAILVIQSKYGYGDRGAGGLIKGGATLYFDVELVSFAGQKKKSKKAKKSEKGEETAPTEL